VLSRRSRADAAAEDDGAFPASSGDRGFSTSCDAHDSSL
jgi:hypothetical protein